MKMQQKIIQEIINKEGKIKEERIKTELYSQSFLKIDEARINRRTCNKDRFSFIDVIRGLIPNTIKRLISKFIKEKEERKKIIQTIFDSLIEWKREKWQDRCTQFQIWEKNNDITTERKRKKIKKKYRKKENRPDSYIEDKIMLSKLGKELSDKIVNKIVEDSYKIYKVFYQIDNSEVLTYC